MLMRLYNTCSEWFTYRPAQIYLTRQRLKRQLFKGDRLLVIIIRRPDSDPRCWPGVSHKLLKNQILNQRAFPATPL